MCMANTMKSKCKNIIHVCLVMRHARSYILYVSCEAEKSGNTEANLKHVATRVPHYVDAQVTLCLVYNTRDSNDSLSAITYKQTDRIVTYQNKHVLFLLT